MNGLILAGGRGKRLGGASEFVNKCMLEINGKPLIEYSLDCLASQNKISKIIIVVGYRAEDIKNKFKNLYHGKEIIYVTQNEQKGLVNAIECASDAIGQDDFMLMLGDEFMINTRHHEFIEEFSKQGIFALCGVLMVSDRNLIKKTYNVITLEDGRIVRLIEKPNNPIFNNIMGTGNCIFKNKILSYIPKTPINQNRQEKELPDLIQCAIDQGEVIKAFTICGEYINVNDSEELDKTKSYFAHL
jgi:dTDP-glucose pyrophosphorylase